VHAENRTASSLRRGAFFAGLALMLLFAGRAQTGGDQLNLLARGWLWAERGVFVPFGNPLSNGGVEPGPLTTVLVGAPLFFWRDARAPIALVFLFHVAAYLLLDRTLSRIVSPRERLLFALVYWLNPWRLYFSGFLWNPNYLFLPAAIHVSTAWASRERPGFGASFAHVLALGAAFQLHPSFVILVFASALLAWRRTLRVHWPGAVCGAAAVGLSLVPWLLALASGQTGLPGGGKGFLLRGLIYVFPLCRGWLYWLRYGSLYLPHDVLRLDLVDLLGARWNARVARPIETMLAAALPFTVALPLWANGRFLRRWRRRLRRPRRLSGRGWLREYTLVALAAATLSFVLAPTTVMPWQAFIALHAAVLPVVFLAESLMRSRRFAARARRTAVAWAVASLGLALILSAGARHYRCSGPLLMGVGEVLRHDHPMFHDLGWSESCPPRFDPAAGWWPDVLPDD
jgi:hypothetical protein